MLTVVAITHDKKNGEIYIHNGGNFESFKDEKKANKEVRRLYNEILEENGLKDNNTCDADGNFIPGGSYDGQEANVYDYADYAGGSLVNIAYICVQEIFA